MKNRGCIGCTEERRCRDSGISWLFFVIGLIATIALRVVTVLIHVNPVYGKTAWYIGVGGFFTFFIYKFRVAQARSRSITKRGLVNKIEHQKELTKEDYGLLKDILCSLSSNKERINYFFIFALSAIAIILAIYFDFIR